MKLEKVTQQSKYQVNDTSTFVFPNKYIKYLSILSPPKLFYLLVKEALTKKYLEIGLLTLEAGNDNAFVS